MNTNAPPQIADQPGAPPGGLGDTTARAVMWNYASFAAGKALVLVTMAILARLLVPEEFGIVGFATIAIAYLAVFKDLGLGGALIQRKDDVEDAADTVYLLNLAAGALLTLITILVAPAVAAFFDEPLVVPLLRVLSFTFVLESLGAVHLVLLRKNLDFRRKLIPDVGRSLIKGAVSITAAATGFGVWALVWGQMAGVIASVALSWAVVAWRPRYRLHRPLVGPLLRFGVPLMATDIQHAIWVNADYVIVGRMLGDTALGIYILAYRLPELLVQSAWRVISQAAFPVFSTIQDDFDTLQRAFVATIRYVQLLVVPMCVGMLVAADQIVAVVFGSQWEDVVPVLRVMSVFLLVASVAYHAGDVYKAIGRPDVLAKLGGLDLIVLIPALILAAPHGLVAVAWAHATVSVLDTTIRLLVARHFIGVRIRTVITQVIPSWTAGAALAGAATAALMLTSGAGPLVELMAAAAAGAAAYFLVIVRLDRPSVERMAGWLGLGRLVRSGGASCP
ncbi:lipopolysaccharide biosynthesis protein [bacterium]|nr:lipopolysaccharide biosynthesis protein [bacterium]